MLRVSGRVSKARQEQIAIERGLLSPKPIEPGIQVHRDPKKAALAAMVQSGIAYEQNNADRFLVLRAQVPDHKCPECDGKGCGEKAVPVGDKHCLRGFLVTKGELSNLRKFYVLGGSQPVFETTILPAILLLKKHLDFDLENATLCQYPAAEPGRS